MDIDSIQVRELAKEEVGYKRQVAIFGKKAADNVLAFWMMGYKYAQKQLSSSDDDKKRLKEMEEAGKEATSLIAHLKDQYGFNEPEQEAQDKIMKVFKYEGRW